MLIQLLFIDMKGVFDYVSKAKLLGKMLSLSIDGDQIKWTKSFLSNQKVELVIDGYKNKEREVETEITQGSTILPILFLIYISQVFDRMTKTYPLVISLSFVGNLEYLASDTLVKNIAQSLEKVAKMALDWSMRNVIIYNTSKTEIMLFFKSCRQQLIKQIQDTKMKIDSKKI